MHRGTVVLGAQTIPAYTVGWVDTALDLAGHTATPAFTRLFGSSYTINTLYPCTWQPQGEKESQTPEGNLKPPRQ